MDRRSRRFGIGVAVAWFVLPLTGGLIGLLLAFKGAQLPFLKGDFSLLFGWGVLGSLLGAGLAMMQTVWSYWRTYLR